LLNRKKNSGYKTECKNEYKGHTAPYRLKEIARILRAENGCPWDRETDTKLPENLPDRGGIRSL
jgi:uncharacterized protein YabN with tetrapyrrole methylase and pyrophosphatase domain